MRRPRPAARLLLALAVSLLLPARAPLAQRTPAPADPVAAAEPGAELRIYLVTMGVGEAIWERFGHNAIRIRDERAGTDSVYNWGTFSFDQPDFLQRFLTGDTRYWLASDGFDETVRMYAYFDRSVIAQELALTPAQRRAVRDYIAWNAREENRYYRYDYYGDNCSTRVRDVIDRALGGQLRAGTEPVVTETSYRWHTRRLLGPDQASYAGIQVALGEPADRPITRWEEMFLPGKVAEYVAALRVPAAPGASGAPVPVVARTDTVYRARRDGEPAAPPARLPLFLGFGVAVGILVLLLGRLTAAGGRGAAWALAGIAAAWSVVAGLVGVLLLLAWTATRHVYWFENENLFLFQPIAFLGAVLLPLLFLRGRAARPALRVALVVAGLGVLALLAKPLPMFDQRNAEVIALALPVHLALAAAAWMVARRAGGTAVAR